MKKFASLIMAVLMLCTMLSVVAVPAFAEEEPKIIDPSSGAISITTAGNYVIKDGEYTIGNFQIGLRINSGVVLTIPEGVTVTVNNNFANYGTLYVNGTLIVTVSNASNMGTINVGCGGKLKGAIGGNGTFTYEEHKFADGKCTKCDTPESEVGKDEPTEIAPKKGANLTISNKDDLIIRENCEIINLNIGNFQNKGMSLTIPKDVTVRVTGNFNNYGTLHVYGTLSVTAGNASNSGTIHVGCGGTIEGTISGRKTVKDEHELTNGFCACGYFDSEQHEHELTNGFCACGYFDLEQHEHIFEDGKCACGEPEPVVGSILSDGNLWIIIAVAVIALGGVAALVIVKKKKKPALAGGENTDEE